MHALIRGHVEPAQRFRIQIGITDKRAAIHEIAAQVAHPSLDLAFRLRAVCLTRANAKTPMPREAKELRILEELAATGALIVDDP
jgi:hypothetical protein